MIVSSHPRLTSSPGPPCACMWLTSSPGPGSTHPTPLHRRAHSGSRPAVIGQDKQDFINDCYRILNENQKKVCLLYYITPPLATSRLTSYRLTSYRLALSRLPSPTPPTPAPPHLIPPHLAPPRHTSPHRAPPPPRPPCPTYPRLAPPHGTVCALPTVTLTPLQPLRPGWASPFVIA